jgi:hypothetical protein
MVPVQGVDQRRDLPVSHADGDQENAFDIVTEGSLDEKHYVFWSQAVTAQGPGFRYRKHLFSVSKAFS